MDLLLDIIGPLGPLLPVHDCRDDSQVPMNMETHEALTMDGPDMVNLVRDAGL